MKKEKTRTYKELNADSVRETSSCQKFKTISKKQNGITLIALIITIIIMLILVGVTVNIALNGGLFKTAKRATSSTQIEIDREQLQASVIVGYNSETGKVDFEKLESDLTDWKIDANTGKCTSPKGNSFIVDEDGNINRCANRSGLNVGDYINYEPEKVNEGYLLDSAYSGYSFSDNQKIEQENLNWQILKIYKDGSMDLIGSPTATTVYFRGALGYNNGVYLMHDICKTLYSRPGIEARSVSLEDFEDEENGGSWKTARDSYTTSNEVQYGGTKTYIKQNTILYYPSLYEKENGSGIGTTQTKRDGINDTDKGYINPTTETQLTADEITITETYYDIPINSINYGETSKALKTSNFYFIASRSVSCDSHAASFELRGADSRFHGISVAHTGYYALYDRGGSLRPIVSLGASVEIEPCKGENSIENMHKITQY